MRTILHNGKIFVEKGIFVQAILIECGLIKSIGLNDIIMSLGADRIIDLKGKTVIPGLNDSHLHITMIGEAMNTCNLIHAKSIEDVIIKGKEFIRDHPDTKVLVGRGWNQDYFTTGEKRLLTRYDLDKISTEIPIVFDRVCIHASSGNSKAIELLHVDNTTQIDGGEIELSSDGSPNGVFKENAVRLIQSIIPKKTKLDIQENFLKGMEYAISVGLTSVQSCDILDKNYKTVFESIQELADEKKLKFRYRNQFNFQDIEDFRIYLQTENLKGRYDEKFYSKGCLKLFKDGSLGAKTALLKEEYNDDKGNFGVEALSDEKLQALCDLAVENNIQLITHAIGDRAIESVIKAYEKGMKNGKNPLRHGIVHNQITTIDQLEKIAKLQIPVMYQPIFLNYDHNIIINRIGEERAKTCYAFNTLYKLGALISLSTDAPIEDCNPFKNIYCAVNRKDFAGNPPNSYQSDECMSVEDAIDAYTRLSAYNEFKEDIKGKLQPGFLADLLILDRDIFTIPTMDIKNVQVETTMVDGNIVYQR